MELKRLRITLGSGAATFIAGQVSLDLAGLRMGPADLMVVSKWLHTRGSEGPSRTFCVLTADSACKSRARTAALHCRRRTVTTPVQIALPLRVNSPLVLC